MYSSCIPYVFLMYLACILITSVDTCIPHVSCMSPSCLLFMPCLHDMSPSLHVKDRLSRLVVVASTVSGCFNKITCNSYVSSMYLECIPHVSSSSLQILVSRMYSACISLVSLHLRYVPISGYIYYILQSPDLLAPTPWEIFLLDLRRDKIRCRLRHSSW